MWTLAQLSLSFGCLLTAHLMIVAGLATRLPRWRALAILVPPGCLLAPYWAHKSGMRLRCYAWVLGCMVYGVCLGIATWSSP